MDDVLVSEAGGERTFHKDHKFYAILKEEKLRPGLNMVVITSNHEDAAPNSKQLCKCNKRIFRWKG